MDGWMDGRWVTNHLTNQPNTNNQKHIHTYMRGVNELRERAKDTHCSPLNSAQWAKPHSTPSSANMLQLLPSITSSSFSSSSCHTSCTHLSLKDYHLTKAQPPASLNWTCYYCHSSIKKRGCASRTSINTRMYTYVIKKNHADRLYSSALTIITR